MQVTNITVGYDRKRQPAQYESAGARVEFSAVIEATVSAEQDHVAVATALLAEAKTIVLTELGIVAAGQSASAYAAKSDAPAAAVVTTEKAPKKKKEAAAAPAATPAPTPAASTAGDIPTSDPAPTAKPAETSLGRTLPAATASAGDIPVDDTPPANGTPKPATAAQVTQAGADELTAAGVQKYITTALVAKKFLPNVILGKLKNEYKVDRVYDLPAEKLAEFYAWVKKTAGE